MSYTNIHTKFPTSRAHHLSAHMALAAALAAAWLAIDPPTLRAATVSYTFSVCSDYSLLMNPQSSSTQSQVSQKSSAVVGTANNNPVIKITNTSATADISEFKMTLTDADSVFNALKLLQAPIGATPAAPFTSSIWGGSTKTIDIVLPTALAPNQSMTFAVNLGPLGGFPNVNWQPGYENIFFQQPITPNTNANLSVTYFDPSSPVNSQTVTNQLPAIGAMDPLVTVTSACCNTPATTVFMTEFGGTAVPEPSSMALVALGCVSMVVPAWRKYRRSSLQAK